MLASDASLGFSPATGSYSVGQTFTVRIVVGSGAHTINAAEGVARFDSSYLTATKVSKDNSVFSLWAIEPQFSNAEGTISFGGGHTIPFTGSAGTVVTVTFKAIKVGTTELSIASGSILAADGKGTNVTGQFGKATLTLNEGAQPTPRPTPPPQATPLPLATPPPAPATGQGSSTILAPEISSPTHPQTDQWYSSNDPEFVWVLPPDIVGVGVSLSQDADTDPGAATAGLIESQSFQNAPDGIWYVHVKFQDKTGATSLSHRKMMIDATPPQSFIVQVRREDPTDPRPNLVFDARDATSGLKHYEVQIDGGDVRTMTIEDFRQEALLNGLDLADIPYPYRMPLQGAGTHTIAVKAIDRAGNEMQSTREIAIEAIEPPKIAWYPLVLRDDSILLLEGTTWPDSTVVIRIQQGEEKPTLEERKAIGTINWNYINKDVDPGTFQISVKAIDKRGAESAFSDPVTVRIVPPALIERFGWYAVGLLLAGLIALAMLVWQRKKQAQRKKEELVKEIKDVRSHMRNVFDALDEEVEEKLKLLMEKPSLQLSDHILEILRGDLETSQELLQKEVQIVEKTAK
ncbi:MAG: cohesin domain-containing protein [bacterium]|nr:cohesin domain-containing protein [bacterium]